MLAREQYVRQEELNQEIKRLSKKLLLDNEIKQAALRMLEIYRGDFRHGYSDFFSLILEISTGEGGCSTECLSNNMEHIRKYIEDNCNQGECEFETVQPKISKLCDHLNLEIGRWDYYSQYEQRMDDIAAKTIATTNDLQRAEEKLDAASKQAASVQTELIAMLSIFAAIVITFSGGLSLLGSALESIGNAKCYEMVILTAIIGGLALFDTIFLLMYLVSKIINRDIFVKCIKKDCSCDNLECSGINQIRRRLPYVFYFNLLCLIGIIVDCAVWLMDVKGIL